jgi:hypothetical protein
MRVCANDEASGHLKEAHCAEKKIRSLSIEPVLDLLDRPVDAYVNENGETVRLAP